MREVIFVGGPHDGIRRVVNDNEEVEDLPRVAQFTMSDGTKVRQVLFDEYRRTAPDRFEFVRSEVL